MPSSPETGAPRERPPGPETGPSAPDLAALRAAMRWRIERARFVLVGFPGPPTPDDCALLGGEGPAQLVREGGETTLLAPEGALAGVVERHPAARVERDLLWVRFELAMAWDVVGFLALVTGRLAAAGIPLGAVCGYSRDHLFVARAYEGALRRELVALFGDAAPS